MCERRSLGPSHAAPATAPPTHGAQGELGLTCVPYSAQPFRSPLVADSGLVLGREERRQAGVWEAASHL